jgi:hypothetical protein
LWIGGPSLQRGHAVMARKPEQRNGNFRRDAVKLNVLIDAVETDCIRTDAWKADTIRRIEELVLLLLKGDDAIDIKPKSRIRGT